MNRIGDIFWIGADQVFDGHDLRQQQALRIEHGKVAAIVPLALVPEGAPLQRVAGCLTPGFFDIQINGGGDALLNSSPTPATIRTIARAHRRFGTTRFLPTVITDAPDITRAACAAVAEAHGRDGVMGIHIEGPHISLARRGTHGAGFIRPLDRSTLDLVAGLRRQGIAVLITLAPEAVAPGQVAALAATGAVVSIGHSDASAPAVQALLDEGASCFTHLFNAMSPMLNRAPGVTGAAINSDAYCSVICDGWHVHPDMLALAIRARPRPDRMILISDAMPTVGGADAFELYGQKVRLTGGRLINSEGSLAGAHTTMAEGVARLAGEIGIGLEATLRMAISNPARLMRLPAESFAMLGRELQELNLVRPDFSCAPLTHSPAPV